MIVLSGLDADGARGGTEIRRPREAADGEG
jgi:hypothetical protein